MTQCVPQPETKMKTWTEMTHYAGFDWAKHHHDIVVVDRAGTIVAELRIAHSAEGWKQWRAFLAHYPALALAVETSQGAAIEQLLESDCTVYPVNPKSARRYRERKVPSGNKTDFLDAWSLADALRVDGHGWRALLPLDPALAELRALCRDEIALIAEQTALVNQLQQALHAYYPTALEAFDDWTLISAWAFVETFPTPQALVAAGRRKWQNFLHAHKLWHGDLAERRLALFAQATEFCGSASAVSAKSRLAVTRVRQLKTLYRQLVEYRARIEELFAQHPDHDLFGSLPGVGAKLGPRLLGELGEDRTLFASAEALQCYAGTAPLCFQSGQFHKVRMRHACNKILRNTVQLWADCSLRKCPWAKVYYQACLQRKKTRA
jgi:transposase